MALEAETKRIVSLFELSDDWLNKAVREYHSQADEGLRSEGTSLSQIPTYVTALPNGKEKGVYLAVDLGGTNFRVCSVRLNGDSTFKLTYNKVAVPKELMTAEKAEHLFGFLAKQIEIFMHEHHKDEFESIRSQTNKDEEIFHLGFTFSYPVKQLAINKGTLIRWTKGFDIPDAIGKDVCVLLQTELDKLHLPVRVAALVNDTVGTLLARSYTAGEGGHTLLGAIFGTGTNGAYIEKLSNIKKPIEGEYDDSTGEMIINTEWGSFDNQLNILPSTTWDSEIDKETVNPGYHVFEKRVSGMFLGEIVRRAVLDMTKNDQLSLFKDANSSSNDWHSTTDIGPAVWSAEAVGPGQRRHELEGTLDIYSSSLEDAQAFKAIAGAVGRRAARLAAVPIAAIVLQSGRLSDANSSIIDIGVDGSLAEYYPSFREMIYEALAAVDGIGPEGAKRIRLGIAKDGSGVGAALIALVAARMEKNRSVANAAKRKLDQVPGGFLDSFTNPQQLALGVTVLGALTAVGLWWARRRNFV
ncbi:hypothetical protein ACRALDRAFT_2025516 [Sodiomyces alcalophilus JCM 7366]|uniref:uncharacterized protein n=1 Tax=Sodiomyces alcalophilus JCM 7366 TaxID=591952 RepID=UPI0039B3DD0D